METGYIESEDEKHRRLAVDELRGLSIRIASLVSQRKSINEQLRNARSRKTQLERHLSATGGLR